MENENAKCKMQNMAILKPAQQSIMKIEVIAEESLCRTDATQATNCTHTNLLKGIVQMNLCNCQCKCTEWPRGRVGKVGEDWKLQNWNSVQIEQANNCNSLIFAWQTNAFICNCIERQASMCLYLCMYVCLCAGQSVIGNLIELWAQTAFARQ